MSKAHQLLWALLLGGVCLAAKPVEDLLVLEARARKADAVEARVEALETIAALQIDGEPASAAITKSLAVGLLDDNPEVRTRTAGLLGEKQHADTAVRKLTEATRAELKQWNKAGAELKEFYTSGKASKLLEAYWTEAEAGVPNAVRHRDEYNEQIETHMAGISTHAGVLDDYFAQLVTWKDDRSVRVLIALLKEVSQGKLAESEVVRICLKRSSSVTEALLTLGSQEALESVIDSIATWTKRTTQAEKTLEKLNEAKPGEYGPWEIGAAESDVRDLRSHKAELGKALKEFAAANNLPRPPGSSAKKSAWRSWKTKTRGKLPKKLGTVAVSEEK